MRSRHALDRIVSDLRMASLTFSPADWMDVRVGRQVLTWGTGDLLFLNDLFGDDTPAVARFKGMFAEGDNRPVVVDTIAYELSD